jgi:hypothetical protein
MDLHPYDTKRHALHVMTVVMFICMASYMMTSYGHANHAF